VLPNNRTPHHGIVDDPVVCKTQEL
jgi:hypothetical protein